MIWVEKECKIIDIIVSWMIWVGWLRNIWLVCVYERGLD